MIENPGILGFNLNYTRWLDWRTDLHKILIDRTGMNEHMGHRIGIRIEYGLGITNRFRYDNGSDLNLKSVEEGNFWFRYWLFSDMKKIFAIFMWSILSFHRVYSVKTLCDCVLLLRSTATLYCCALLLRSTAALHCCTPPLRFTVTLYANPPLLRFPLSNTYYKSVILETTFDSDTTRSSERLRQGDS